MNGHERKARKSRSQMSQWPPCSRHDKGFRRILDGEAPEQELVGFGVLVGLLDDMCHVVPSGKKSRGAQDDDREPELEIVESAVVVEEDADDVGLRLISPMIG